MKRKNFTIFFTALLMLIGGGEIWGQTTEIAIVNGNASGLPSTASATPTTITQDGFSYSVVDAKYTASNDASGTAPSDQLHGGTSGGKTILFSKNTGWIHNTAAFGTGITKIRVKSGSSCSTSATFGILIGDSEITEKPDNDFNFTGTTSEVNKIYEFNDIPSGKTYFAVSSTNNKNLQLSIEITYSSASSSPTCTIDPTEYDFGTVGVGQQASTTFTVTTANLTGDLTVSLYGYDESGAFSIPASSQTILQSATSTEITVNCHPSAAGELEELLVISGGGITEVNVNLTATAAWTVTASSNNDEWGTVVISDNSITATPNTGYTYAEPAYTVTPAGVATVEQVDNIFTVTPSANCNVQINFAESTTPVCTIDPTEYDFGTVGVGQQASTTFTVTTANLTGDLTVSLYGYDESGAFSIPASSQTILQSATSTEITVNCHPSAAGELEELLVISGGGITEVNVNLTATAAPVYTVTFDPGSGTVTPASLSGVTINLSELTVTPPTGWTLYGWALEATDGATTSAPKIVSDPYTPTGNVTLYAVYMKVDGGAEPATWIAKDATDNPGNGNDWFTSPIDANTSWSATKGGSNNPKYYDTGEGLRVYSGGTFTVTSSITISEITLTFSGTGYTFSTENTTTPQSVNPNSTSYSWDVSRTCRLQKVEISYASTTTYNSNPGIGTVATPEFSVADGNIFTGNEGSVTITCETEGAAIQYSFDNENWNTYSAAVTVNAENHTIYAKATKTSYDPSATVSASYDFLTTLGAKALVYTNGEKYFAITQSLEEYGNYSSNGLPGEEITVTNIEDVLTANVPDNNLVWTVQQLAVSGKYLFKTNSTEKYLQLASDFNIALGDMDATAILTATGSNPYIFSGNSLYLEYFANYSTFCATSNITYASSIYLMPYVIPTHYDISLTQPSEGTISATPSSAIEGATVTLTYDNGGSNYVVSSWTVIGDVSGNNIEVIDNTFTMPAENVTVSATLATTYTITVNNPDGATITASATSALPGTEITISYELEEYYTFNAWNVYQTEGEIPVTVEGNTFTMPAANVTVTASVTAPSTHTVTLMCNGTVLSSAPVVSLELPTPDAGNIPNGFTFIGWSTATVSDTDDEPVTMVASPYTPTEDITLYAVFAIASGNNTWNKVMSGNDIAGEYLIVYSSSNSYYVFNGKDENNGYISANASSEGVIDDNVDLANGIVEIATMDGGYSLMVKNGDNAGKYMSGTSGSNKLNFNNEAQLNTISINGGVATITSNSAQFKFNKASNNLRFRYYATGQEAVSLYKYYPKTITNYTTSVEEKTIDETISSNTTWTEPTAITNAIITIESGVTLTATAGLTNTNPANLVIEDGGQLIINNAGVQATVQKNISAYTNNEGTDNYYFIGSPVAENVAGQFAQGTYDLYKYDEATTCWKNYEAANFDIELGYGYLYANNEGRTVGMVGEVNVGTINITDLSYTTGSLAGFHLFGNPYTHDIYYGEGFVLAEDYSGYYVPNAAGELVVKEMAEPVKAGQGFMMQIVEGGDEIEFNNTNAAPTAKRAAKQAIQLTVGNGQFEDKAYFVVSKGYGLGKLSHFNENAPMLWVRNGNADYAIATTTEMPNSIPVSFKAGSDGAYTLSVDAKGLEADYLHLIDHVTGADVDLLSTPSYTFEARKTDYAARFRIVFSQEAPVSDGESFAYVNGGRLVIENEGAATVQITDIAGRVLRRENIQGGIDEALNLKPGMYIVSLLSQECVRSQKLVVE